MSDPVDLSKLDPAVLAKHLANPQGPLGIAITAAINKTNAGPYTAACAKLALQKGDRILEIGFGNGHEIGRLLASAPSVIYTGVDFSETMVSEAASRNAAAIEQRRVSLRHGSSSALPFPLNSFDKALALNTIYFWENPLVDITEIRRVLREGGRFVLGSVAPRSTKTREVFRHGFCFYETEELTNLFKRAGFASVDIQTLHEDTVSTSGEQMQRDYFIVTGR